MPAPKISCNPQDLVTAARCFRCIPTGLESSIITGLLCQWLGAISPTNLIVIPDGSGGFWTLVVDDVGNIGTESVPGPATANVVLDDGVGGFWLVVVDNAGNRGTSSTVGPATIPVPVLTDGLGNHWELVVDSGGNLGALSV